MRDSMSAWPEMVLVDGTYQLTNRHLTLMIFLVQNGTGRGEVVGSALLAYEDKESLKWVVEKFQQANQESCKNTRCFMTDKDLTERNAIQEVFPTARLLLCTFHTLKAFKAWCDKSKLSAEEKAYANNMAEKLTYSDSDDHYHQLYADLVAEAPVKFTEYYNANWHGIKDKWIRCKMAFGNFGNYTNNLLESLNKLVKQVVKKNSAICEFANKYFEFLRSHNQETDTKSALQLLKTPTNVVTGNYTAATSKYCTYLTQHAFKAVSNELILLEAQTVQVQDEGNKICIIESTHGTTETTPTECSCVFRNSWDLPCKHMFAVRKYFNMPIFEASLCAERWTKDYTFQRHRLNTRGTPELSRGQPLLIASPSIQVTPKKKKPSTTQKRKAVNAIGSHIADILFNSCDLRYENRCSVVDQLINVWSEGDEVKVVRVKSSGDSGQYFSPGKSEPENSPRRALTENHLSLPVSRRIFGSPSGSGKTTTGFFPRKRKRND